MSSTAPRAEPGPPTAVLGGRRGLRIAGVELADAAVLGAILLLVALVSLPQLEAYARRTNEADARWTVSLLGGRLEDAGAAARPDLPDWVAQDARLAHRLRDARRVAGTSDLVFHGYFFRLDPAGRSLVAWPRRAGRTGARAYAWRAGQGLWALGDPLGPWSGDEPRGADGRPLEPPDPTLGGGWVRLPAAETR